MKRRFLIPLLLLPAGCGGSNEPPASTASVPPPTTVAAAPSPSGPSIVVEVVTIDTAAPSITLREGDVPAGAAKASNLKAGDRTLRVEPSAAASLSGVKPGMRVRVTCSAPLPVATEAPPPAGAASPGKASPAVTMAAPPAAAQGPLARCDSIVAITPLEAMAP
ncbi:MAG TPA: hypothetical protein VIK51_04185 [Vicinamibacteria bacterium]